MSDKIKLPSNMRVCEGCGYFQALTNGNEIICAKLGRIPNGVALCQVKGVYRIVYFNGEPVSNDGFNGEGFTSTAAYDQYTKDTEASE